MNRRHPVLPTASSTVASYEPVECEVDNGRDCSAARRNYVARQIVSCRQGRSVRWPDEQRGAPPAEKVRPERDARYGAASDAHGAGKVLGACSMDARSRDRIRTVTSYASRRFSKGGRTLERGKWGWQRLQGSKRPLRFIARDH